MLFCRSGEVNTTFENGFLNLGSAPKAVPLKSITPPKVAPVKVALSPKVALLKSATPPKAALAKARF